MTTYHFLILFFVLEYVRPNNYIYVLNFLHLNTLVPFYIVAKTAFGHSTVSLAEAFGDNKLILWLLGLILLAIPTSQSSGSAVSTFWTVAGYVMIAVAITRLVTDVAKVKGVFRVLILVHVIVAALTPQMLLDPSVRHYVASGAFLGDGNDFALSVCLVVPFCLFLLFDASKLWHKVVYGFTLLVFVLCVIATQSRGGTIALAFVGLYYWFKSKRKLTTGVLAVATLAVVLLFAPPTYFERMNTIATYESDGSAQGRLSAWGASVGMAMSNPLLGVGAGQFAANYTRFTSSDQTRWMTAHSIYFLLLGELGLPGLGLLLAIIFWNLAANRRLAKEIEARKTPEASRDTQLLASLSVSLIAFATGGAFLSAIYYPHIYILSGLMAASRRVARQHQAVETFTAKPAASLPALKTVRPRVRNSPLAVGTAAQSTSLEKHGRFF